MYFTSYSTPLFEAECRDGGLQMLSPVHLAVNECRRIWGNATNIDLLLSIGAGYSETISEPPSTRKLLPDWVQRLFANFVGQLNGEEIYHKFLRTADEPLRTRLRRLNIKFGDPRQSALDEFEMLESIRSEAAQYSFSVRPNSLTGHLKILGDNKITDVALRLQALLFFYQPSSVSKHSKKAYTVHGAIHCRLNTRPHALKTLLARIQGFCFNGQELRIPSSTLDAGREQNKPFELSHSFTHSVAEDDQPVCIEAIFSNKMRAPISGFPCTISVRAPLKPPLFFVFFLYSTNSQFFLATIAGDDEA